MNAGPPKRQARRSHVIRQEPVGRERQPASFVGAETICAERKYLDGAM